MFVCVKDRTCLRMAIPAYCFSIFGSIFGALFCLLIKKLILECDTIWQSMRKFLQAVWSVSTFSHNLKLNFSENLAALTFLREKVSTFAESKWYMYTLWLLITLCNMPKGLVT